MGNMDILYPPAGLECAHRVPVPPSRPFIQTLRANLKETFFPDDPLRQFKGGKPSRSFLLFLQYMLPILEWAPSYTLKIFKSDLIAGITIASLAIPQGISYAKLANLPPVLGLYSSFVPPLVYAMMGSSKDIAVGTVAVPSLLLGSMLAKEVSPLVEPVLYLQLAFTATFFAGVFDMALGLLSGVCYIRSVDDDYIRSSFVIPVALLGFRNKMKALPRSRGVVVASGGYSHMQLQSVAVRTMTVQEDSRTWRR